MPVIRKYQHRTGWGDPNIICVEVDEDDVPYIVYRDERGRERADKSQGWTPASIRGFIQRGHWIETGRVSIETPKTPEEELAEDIRSIVEPIRINPEAW